MQLASKMRFIAAQFEALLTNDLWRRSAEHANRMARLLEAEVRKIPQVKIVWKVEANGVFAQIPRHAIAKIKERYFFYPWIEEECIVRWMCSFDTTEEDVKEFAKVVAEAVKGVIGGTLVSYCFLLWPLTKLAHSPRRDMRCPAYGIPGAVHEREVVEHCSPRCDCGHAVGCEQLRAQSATGIDPGPAGGPRRSVPQRLP